MSKESWLKILGLVLVAAALWIVFGKERSGRIEKKRVVVYVQEPKKIAEPLLKTFTKKYGIRVRALYGPFDKEAARADLFWLKDPLQASMLRQRIEPAPIPDTLCADTPSKWRRDVTWCPVAGRAWIFAADKNLTVSPASYGSLTDPFWRGRILMPAKEGLVWWAALFEKLGPERGEAFFRATLENGLTRCPTGGECARLIAMKEAAFALVEPEDAEGVEGIELIVPEQHKGGWGMLVVPSVLVLAQKAKGKKEAQTLARFLLSKEAERRILSLDPHRYPIRTESAAYRGLAVWSPRWDRMERSADLQRLYRIWQVP